MLSANGWSVLKETPPRQRIPGTDISLSVRPGDVATVLLEVASRFHREVESLTLPVTERPGYDDWGWAYRPIRGQSTGFSNHASGCAVDLNATRHPRGIKGTFSGVDRTRVRRILASTLDSVTGLEVVRWGEDFTTTIDGMHFEVVGSPMAVARVADRIRRKNRPRPAPPVPPAPQEEDDDMKSDDQIDLGPWSATVLGEPDRKISFEECVAIQTASLAQMNETVHAMAATMAALAADVAALRKSKPAGG